MKKIFVLLSLIVFGVELFAQGGMVDINNNEYNQAVERLILSNFERPSYRMNFEPFRESFIEMHTSMSVSGEESFIARYGLSRSVFIQNCVDKYYSSELPKDYATLISPYLKQYVSTRDIEIALNEMNNPELNKALIKLEGIGTSIEMPNEEFWNDAIVKISQGVKPNSISERYCSSNYKALFEDYYMVSNTDMIMEALIDGQLVGVEEMNDPEYAEIIRKYKLYMMATIKTICLNFCIESSISERELQICVNYNSLPEYQNLSHGLVAAMNDMSHDTENIGAEMWAMYSHWVSHYIANQDTYSFDAVELDVRPTFMGGDTNNFSRWVNQHLVYPEIAKDNGVQGRVTLKFTIDENGRLCNIEKLRGVDPALDAEAIRVVSSSPEWTPGYLDGRPVRVTYTFPVIFQLR
jgi:TonB family protein